MFLSTPLFQSAIILALMIPSQISPSALSSRNIAVTQPDSEYRVMIHAMAPNTSWEIEGRECALVKVLVDGRYDQHVFLVRGAEAADYEFLVGPLSPGDHTLLLEWDRSWTPELKDRPEVQITAATPINRSDPAQEPILRAPILHIRKDTFGRFSDLPLMIYWESESKDSPKKYTYTVILTNEDGGTNTERLMSRWGRTTDIEWIYDYAPGAGSAAETYQAQNHKTLTFRGKHEGLHPVLYDVTRNNNFADSDPDPSAVRVRLVPVFADLHGLTRESVMDRFPWTYALMAREMVRENKIEYPADPNTAAMSDQQNYAYIDICAEQRGTELFFELETRNPDRWYRSDHADPKARIERSGCFRTTIELPPGTAAQNIRRLRIQCTPAPVAEGASPVSAPQADISRVTRLFFLAKDYSPGPNLLDKKVNRALKPGQSLVIPLDIKADVIK